MKKLRSRRGETLTETLVALLVVAFSALLLFTLTASAVRMLKASAVTFGQVYAEVGAADARLVPSGTVQVTVNGKTVTVPSYGDGLKSYGWEGTP